MDTFQIISIILLSFIVTVLGIGLVIGYMSAARRDVAAKGLQDAVEKMTIQIKELSNKFDEVTRF